MAESLTTRKYWIRIVFVIGALALLGKAMFIQLIDDTYRVKGTTAGIDEITIYPARGLIYDRNEKLLVNNVPMYDLMVTYSRINPQMDTAKFCALLGISKETFIKNLEKDWKDPRFSKMVPFVFQSKIAADTFARFQESLYEFPGFFTQVRNIRSYPFPYAAHLLGYIREVNAQEVENPDENYVAGDYIGGSGLELAYERLLKGRKGVSFILKDKFGREIGPYKNGDRDTMPLSGKDLISTIDIDLQAYGEQLMQHKTGSIVAIEPSTGEILALVSMPTYDPNLLTINSNRGRAFKALSEDQTKPFFDRSVVAKYPPGSIFKTVVALVAMQTGVITPNQGFSCAPGYYYNGRLYKCHGHPYASNVSIALQHSCNSYFWQTFRRIIDKHGFYQPQKGLAEFDEYVYQFGLGSPLGIDFPQEQKGNVPTPGFYDQVYNGSGGWKSPTIMSVGIGQGEMQLTSVQMANLAAIMANRGYFYTPHLVKGFKNDTSKIDEKYRARHDIKINKEYFDYVANGMEGAVSGGTATLAYIWDLSVCGKTGTAQNNHGEDHSVFFGFAPKDNPKIAISVYVENAGWGGSYAAPIASLIIEKYINGFINENRKYLEQRMIEVDLINQP